MNIKIYDTSLRDGLQGEKIKLNLEDKINLAYELDKLGVDYIEGGFPLASKQEEAFFKKVKHYNFKKAKITAFGSTRKLHHLAEEDPHLKALLLAETETVTIVGKSSPLHVEHVLKISLEDNLKVIEESVYFLKQQGREVIYDAEHFFDGMLENEAYALKTIKAALNGGADTVVLCDTNGGIIYQPFIEILKKVSKIPNINLGIHLHNDTESAVSNSLISLDYGITQIQGTI